MQINRGTEYAIRAALYLALHAERTPIVLTEIADGIGAPQNYLSNLLQSLARFNIVQSHRGARRGYSLARPAREIDLLQILEALEGPLAVHCCATLPEGGCPLSAGCSVSDVFQRIEGVVRRELSAANLADLSGAHGRSRPGPGAGSRSAP